jgi:mono/diheme cytochrome c family protein
LVAQSVLLRPYLFPILLVMAAIQIGLQTLLFMHLNVGRPVYGIFFGFGVAMAAVVGGGTFLVVQATTAPPPSPPAVAAPPTSRPSTPPSSGPKPPPSAPSSPAQLLAMGEKIVTTQCEACHKVNGAGATVGPDLNLVMEGKPLPGLAPGSDPKSTAWLARWIANPQAVWPQASMPNLGLTPQQVEAVVTYLTQKVK